MGKKKGPLRNAKNETRKFRSALLGFIFVPMSSAPPPPSDCPFPVCTSTREYEKICPHEERLTYPENEEHVLITQPEHQIHLRMEVVASQTSSATSANNRVEVNVLISGLFMHNPQAADEWRSFPPRATVDEDLDEKWIPRPAMTGDVVERLAPRVPSMLRSAFTTFPPRVTEANVVISIIATAPLGGDLRLHPQPFLFKVPMRLAGGGRKLFFAQNGDEKIILCIDYGHHKSDKPCVGGFTLCQIENWALLQIHLRRAQKAMIAHVREHVIPTFLKESHQFILARRQALVDFQRSLGGGGGICKSPHAPNPDDYCSADEEGKVSSPVKKRKVDDENEIQHQVDG